jgi:hypothetical protein
MFAKNGYTPIVELFPWFLNSIAFWTSAPINKELRWTDFEDRAGNEVWSCLVAAPEIFVSTLQGDMITVSHDAITNGGERYGFRNTHVDVRIGTLGSGSGILGESTRDFEAIASERFSRVHYGPVAFHPLAISKGFWVKYKTDFENLIRNEFGYASQVSAVERDYVGEILELYDAGKAKKRDEYKARLAPEMKFEEWKVHWNQAASRRPDLSKPGPRK